MKQPVEKGLTRLVAAGAVVVTTALASPASANDAGVPGAVTWDMTAVLMGGSACSKGVDAFVLQNGSDLSMVFSNLGVALDEGAPQVREAACTVQVGALVPPRLYPTSVTQSYDYGVTRTAGSTGTLLSSIRLLGIAIDPVPLTVSASGAHLVATRTDTWSTSSPWFAKWCAPTRPTSGTLTASFRARASTATAADSIVLFVDGLGLRYDFSAVWQRCDA